MKVTPITANFVADIEDVNLATINDTESVSYTHLRAHET